jgi:hypothetical protein
MKASVVGTAAANWRPTNGLKALVICILGAEGVIAGLGRDCMPSFNLGILGGQLLLMNMFGVPEIMGVVAGIPAFLIAAYPPNVGLRRYAPTLSFTVLVALVVALVGAMRSGFWGFLFAVGLIAAGAVIGIWTRALLAEFRWIWLLAGILLALAAGSVVFSFGHYGQNNCWP